MGTSSLGDAAGEKLNAPQKVNLLGLVTLTYGVGQIAGPLMVSVFDSRGQSLTGLTLLGAGHYLSRRVLAIYNTGKQNHNRICAF
jgi:hypothetical protein